MAERDHIKVNKHGLLDMNLKYQIVLDTVNLVKNFETEILIPHEGQHASGTYTSRAATLFFPYLPFFAFAILPVCLLSLCLMACKVARL